MRIKQQRKHSKQRDLNIESRFYSVHLILIGSLNSLLASDEFCYRLGEGTLPWATPCLGRSRFFLNEKKINIFRLRHIALFLKVTYSNFVEKNHTLYCFSWKFTFSMSKVNFLMFGFIETKRLNIDSFTNGN